MQGPADIWAVRKRKGTFDADPNSLVNVDVDAISGEYHVVDEIEVSFDGPLADNSPAATFLRLSFFTGDPGWVTVWEVDISTPGPHVFRFPRGLSRGVKNEAMGLVLGRSWGTETGKASLTYR